LLLSINIYMMICRLLLV